MSQEEDIVASHIADKISGLTHARQLIFEALSRFATEVTNFSDENRIYVLQARLEKVQLLWAEFAGVQADLELFDKNTDHSEFRLTFEDMFFNSTGAAKVILDCYFRNMSLQANSTQKAAQFNANLPKLQLPEFYGSYDKWLQFSGTFKSLIHNSTSLVKIEKFWYLKSCLKGDAANLLTSLEVSEANYDKAWKILCDRYENKRVIIQTHLKAIFDIQSISKESHVSIRSLVDTSTQHLRALESLGLPIQSWDTIMIFHIASKLDTNTRRQWEDFSLTLSTDTPTLDNLTSFLTKQCQILENMTSTKSTLHKLPPIKLGSHSSTFTITDPSCILCNKNHKIFTCTEFLKLSPQERLYKIRKLRACTNCFRPSHVSKDCKSTFSCKKCSARHNSLLHFYSDHSQDARSGDNQISSASVVPRTVTHQSEGSENSSNNSHTLSVTNNYAQESPYILLSTASVIIFDSRGKPHSCRALLDNCSQSNFITEKLFNTLNIPARDISHSVEGFGNSLTRIFKTTCVNIKSTINSFNLNNVPCLITNNITRRLPEVSFKTDTLGIPRNITLADNNFNVTAPIDMLIGASIFWKLICVGQIVLPNNATILQKTKLGWVISGPLTFSDTHTSLCNLSIDTSTSLINDQLEKFWRTEECQITHFKSQAENQCEQHFLNTTFRDDSGRFVVSLPFKDNISHLGLSFDTALKRFYAIEKRLDNDPKLKAQYVAFLSEYEQLDHMSKIETSSHLEHTTQQDFFLPHHGVVKETSSTTKLRVVFDGSAKSTSGISLNETLKVGPKLQDDLMDIVLRFRINKFAFTADIEKMYRCVMVKEGHRNFQKILWRNNRTEKIDHYSLNTVTYGTSCAAFLAVRSLQQVAMENKVQFPIASEKILSSFYVDDLLCGCKSIEEGQKLISEINHVLQSAGFKLRKWVVSDDALLSGTSGNSPSANHKIISDENDTIKTLGLTWNSKEDTFQYTVDISKDDKVTKRSILAIIAKIFDPMGLIAPCIIKAKIMLQSLWQLGLDWDESVPMELHNSWNTLCRKLPLINDVKIPRCILTSNPLSVELHGFSDASMKAYGACCYLRSVNSSDETHVSLICAKSRVAPVKTISLPRLELCGALLLARLVRRLLNCLKINIDSCHYWTDSTVVLSWISLQPNQLNIFVANRISEIQQSTTVDQWQHISSENNPADIILRGLDPDKLNSYRLWWLGPPFLMLKRESWPQNVLHFSDPPEVKQPNLTLITQENIHISHIDFIERYSSFTKLQRLFAYCLRFINNSRTQETNSRFSGPLTKTELQNSVIALCKMIQSYYLSDELKYLKNSTPLSSNSPILYLNPFLDENNLIRVGGRLKFSNLSFDAKHPILLPNKLHFTKIVILYEHHRHLHAGAQATLASIRLNFWIINGRSAVQKLLRKCVVCFKVKPTYRINQMGNLPKSRVTPQRPFQSMGVDFAGPLLVKDGKAKNRILVKTYLCVFVCFTTKAVHLELAGDLSSESFLNCLKRFVSRRGICSELYSDNGTNFVGAERELRGVLKQIINSSEFSEFSSTNNITWHLSPPYAPNFGGLWEACVKSAKFHLKRIVGNAHLTYESLLTVLVQIEAVLNSRPLMLLSSDPNDFCALTPSHFIIGEPLTALPQTDVRHISQNRLSHYKRLQQQVQHFWQRWSTQYLSTLQERSKWRKQCPNVKAGTLVLIKDENSAPLCWKLGRICEVMPGKDDIVRVVRIKTNSGVLKRPVSRVCALPLENY